MKTYQPNNGPIKFVVVNSEYNDDHAYNKTIIDVLYTTKRYELSTRTMYRQKPTKTRIFLLGCWRSKAIHHVTSMIRQKSHGVC